MTSHSVGHAQSRSTLRLVGLAVHLAPAVGMGGAGVVFARTRS